ncbi:MAG: hypothetical protein HY784_18275 [Chloroflexi bacterium]|nr:hypothetical protein [Chloroflexota bacterium]
MGTYGMEGVLRAWRTGSLTTEQAVGQILQLLQALEKRVRELERLSAAARPAREGQHFSQAEEG